MGASNERAPGHAALWVALSALVLVIGSRIGVPGVDLAMLEHGSSTLLGMFGATTVRFGVVGMSVGSLVAARLVLMVIGKTESATARSIAFVVYLVLALVQGLSIALWLESLGASPPYIEVVEEPGWKFRMTAALTWTAGATVLWWLADRIDRTRAATGALAIALVASLLHLFFDAGARGASWGGGEIGAIPALASLILPLAMLALAVMIAVRTPAKWPVKIVRELELRSWFDVIAVPCVVSALRSTSTNDGGATLLAWSAAIVIVTAVLAVLWPRRVERGTRSLLPLAPAVGALALIAAPLALGFVSSGGLGRALDPGPLAGEARFEITLAAVDRFRSGEAEAMVARLTALGADANVISATPERVTLLVENAVDSHAVLDVLRPHYLTFHLVNDFPSDAVPPPGVVLVPTYETRHAEGECRALESWALSVGCTARLERAVDELAEPGSVERCGLYCIEEPFLTSRDVTDARVMMDQNVNLPVVLITLSDRAGLRLEEITAENVHRQLAIVVDAEVMSAPVIQSRISGGRAQITLGHAERSNDLLNEANTLAVALRSGDAVTSAWTLESIR